jgi:cell volume regulation protein A
VEVGSHLILIGAALVLLSIMAGLLSSRVGAPLLLVFLGLGMLAGEDGPGGLDFDNFHVAYMAGSLALAVILFDGGLRTRFSSFRVVWWPAFLLATVGVIITAALTAVAAQFFAGLSWLEAVLVGSIVGSTDAAAVFLLLHQSGMGLQRRVQATLEIESGINDPMAIFLTVACVELLAGGAATLEPRDGWLLLWDFVLQMLGGGAIGFVGGHALVAVVNRLSIVPGLYPILALAGALFLFAGAQTLGASGFLAVYIAGLILGNRPHRAEQSISRFHDGMAWLVQIGMFLMLGLLVTPTRLVDALQPALIIAAVLMLVARPVAVWLCLAPFRFTRTEIAFVSWVGLRGAVPIFLATVPVLAGLPGGLFFFDVAFVVVLASLVLQGWTVAVSARTLDLDLPPQPETPTRTEIDLPVSFGRNLTGYMVRGQARIVGQELDKLALPPDADIVSAFRAGRRLEPGAGHHLMEGDYVLAIAPPERMATLDKLFATRRTSGRNTGLLGEFEVDGDAQVTAVMALYDLQVEPEERGLRLGELLEGRIGRMPVEGDRVRLGELELIVHTIEDDRIVKVGLELDPEHQPRRGLMAVPAMLRRWRGRVDDWRGRHNPAGRPGAP